MSTENQNEPTPTSGPAVGSSDLLDAGSVCGSSKRYVVTWPHEHKTLKLGDVVVMVVTPRNDNLLLREIDMTLHGIKDEYDQYIHLAEVEAANL
jgi:hypothetical protein